MSARRTRKSGSPPTNVTRSLALCHEWLASRSGSEKTFEAMAEALPGADLFALTYTGGSDFTFAHRPVQTTFLDRIGILADRRPVQLPLMPMAWRRLSNQAYGVVVTSSHACAKGFFPGRAALHLCYCHTPMRYAWVSSVDQRHHRSVLTGLAESVLRKWDRRSAEWVDYFAANSAAVASRILRYYGRTAEVIHPPVDTKYFSPGDRDRSRTSGALAVSRMIGYKRLDIAIKACHRAGVALTVAGSGPEETRLRELADRLDADVTFVIKPSDAHLRELYRSAQCMVFPAEEDFGIVSVESQACGTPVVALAKGGSLDTVVHGVTGVLVNDNQVEDFADGILVAMEGGLTDDACRDHAQRFSRERFITEFHGWVRRIATAHGLEAALEER